MKRADVATRAGPVLNYNRPLQSILQSRGNQATSEIDAPAGWLWDNNRNSPVRIALRMDRSRQREQHG